MSESASTQTISSVLVVDNDPGVCTFMEVLLEKEEMEVRTAEDGLQALSVLETFSPDLMFIDLVMPNISGDKLGQVLRSQTRFNDTYLIVLSAISSEEEVDYLSWGFDACIAKGPFRKQGEVVLSVIKKLGSEITRERPGGIFGVENLYKREITRELLSTKRHFELILKNMSESIIETTQTGEIVFVNPAATTLLGTTEQEILSTDLDSLFDGQESRRLVRDALRQARSEGTSQPVVIDHHGKIVTLHVLTVEDDGSISVVIIAADVTETHRAQVALRNAHDELELRVRDRTAELAAANEALQKEIERRTDLEHRLRASLREKEVMLDEIHHRVKNNLQVISSLMGLNANRLHDPASRDVIADMRRRVHSLSLVHDRLYQSRDLSGLDAQDYFRRLVDGLVGSLMDEEVPVAVTINAEGVGLPVDVAVPCALITNEVITNSLKHGFAGRSSGEVVVAMTRNDDLSLTLVISDNGVGIAETVDVHTPTGLGLRIIKVLAKQLGATFRLSRTNGTQFRFDIPPGKLEKRRE